MREDEKTKMDVWNNIREIIKEWYFNLDKSKTERHEKQVNELDMRRLKKKIRSYLMRYP